MQTRRYSRSFVTGGSLGLLIAGICLVAEWALPEIAPFTLLIWPTQALGAAFTGPMHFTWPTVAIFVLMLAGNFVLYGAGGMVLQAWRTK